MWSCLRRTYLLCMEYWYIVPEWSSNVGYRADSTSPGVELHQIVVVDQPSPSSSDDDFIVL